MLRPSVVSVLVLGLAGSLASASEPRADTLLIDRVQAAKNIETPARGQSMASVEARFGNPIKRLQPRGGEKPQWPPIHRWIYQDFTVYFEHSHVINVVVRQATPLEVGPKPAE